MAQALNIEGIDSSVVLLVAGSGLAEPGDGDARADSDHGVSRDSEDGSASDDSRKSTLKKFLPYL